ncbi:hypothetical protein HED60_15985 [Planctomycetales bacterium ZRK34]|nr:hypothetical protein HED60_15985 [Planctomycetales bacterium ZRK34]
MVILQCLVLIGCQSTPKTNEPVHVDVDALREAQNRRVAMIDQIWSRSVLEVRWTDTDGDKHYEQGDGPLIIRKPAELALAVGKLGETFLWLGADGERYWLFDLHPPNDQPKTAYLGRFDQFTEQAAAKLPIPIRPDRLISLLGITPLPAANEQSPIPLTDDTSATFMIPQGNALDGPRMYLRIDAASSLPSHVTVVDELGRILLHARLDQYEPLKRDGAPPGAWPALPTRITVTSEQYDATLTLHLDSPTDGKARDKVKDAQFDFDTLVKMLRPEKIESLDAEPKTPAKP